MKLLKVKEIKGKLEIVTGLHIGAGSDSIEIGGMDNPIIRNPINNEPYIPGSSIKGKLRSIMEWVSGKVIKNNGNPCNCGECEICTVFGVSAAAKDEVKAKKRGPTRLLVRDAFLTKEWRDKFRNDPKKIIEEKHENSINRITAKANPRPIERVAPGVQFDFSMSYFVFDRDDGGKGDEDNFKSVILKSLAYLEKNYLGGGGSRGNGQIKFIDLKVDNDQIDISPYI